MLIDQVETGSFASPASIADQPRIIQVLSWNIARGCKLPEITEFLLTANADLLILQEVDWFARRSGYRNIAAVVAQELKMNYAFGIEFQELAQGSPAAPAYHGQATLSRWPISNSRVVRFRKQSNYWSPRWWIPSHPLFQRRLGGRMALLSHVRVGLTEIAVYNLHLESRSSDDLRRSQLVQVLDDTIRYSDVPVVVAGDLNFDLTEPGNASVTKATGLHNPFADLRVRTVRSASSRGGGTIDWILVRRPAAVMSPQVCPSVTASDHYPLRLTLELPSIG